MLNVLKYLPLAAMIAGAAPLAAQEVAQELGQETAEKTAEVYEGGVNCGALHSFMSGALEGEDDAAAKQYFDSASRFFMLALVRDEENAELDMDSILDGLLSRIEALEGEAEVEKLLTAGIEKCETFRASVTEEYDSIDLTE